MIKIIDLEAKGIPLSDEEWDRVKTLADLGVLAIKKGKRQYGNVAEWAGKALKLNTNYAALIQEMYGLQTPDYGDEWRLAVQNCFKQVTGIDSKTLEAKAIKVIDMSATEVCERLKRLLETIQTTDTHYFLSEISAQFFRGDAKALDESYERLENSIERWSHRVIKRPLAIHIHLEEQADSILWIENFDVFESLVRSMPHLTKSFHLGYSGGFLATSKALRNPDRTRLFLSDRSRFQQLTDFKKWLFDGVNTYKNIYFWGDLDWAGLQIYKALQQQIPEIQLWPTAYSTMMDRVEAGEGHRPEQATARSKERGKQAKQNQVKVQAVNDTLGDQQVIPFLEKHNTFLDQEAVLKQLERSDTTSHHNI